MASVFERTGAEELTEQECWRLLDSRSVGRLAVAFGRYPDVFPVNFAVYERTIVLRTEGGSKLAGAVLGPAVAFEVDRVDEITCAGWSVVVKGFAEEVVAIADIAPLEQLDLHTWSAREKTRWVRIHPTEVTGRRVGPNPEGPGGVPTSVTS